MTTCLMTLLIRSLTFYYPPTSSPKATDCKLSSDQVVIADVRHCWDYCFYQRKVCLVTSSSVTPQYTRKNPKE
ncbi:hypothetical protein ACTXT7_004648 [Hymenolepis weldensis]